VLYPLSYEGRSGSMVMGPAAVDIGRRQHRAGASNGTWWMVVEIDPGVPRPSRAGSTSIMAACPPLAKRPTRIAWPRLMIIERGTLSGLRWRR